MTEMSLDKEADQVIIECGSLEDYLDNWKRYQEDYVAYKLNKVPRFFQWLHSRQIRKIDPSVGDLSLQAIFREQVRFKVPDLFVREIKDSGYDNKVILGDCPATFPVLRRDMALNYGDLNMIGFMEVSNTASANWSSMIYTEPNDIVTAILLPPTIREVPIARVQSLTNHNLVERLQSNHLKSPLVLLLQRSEDLQE